MSEAHYRKLERMYEGAPTNDHYDAALAVADGCAEVTIPVAEKHFHPGGAVHGAVYFKALDDAAFFAAQSGVEDVFLLTTDFDLYLTRPVSSGHVRAVGEVVNDNPRQLVAEAVARDADGNQLARGAGSFARSGTELDAEMGYE